MPPGDTGALITARMVRRRRRRTASVALASLVAVVAGAGVANAVSSGTSTASPGYADATPSAVVTRLPALPTLPVVPVPTGFIPVPHPAVPLSDPSLTFDPSTGTLDPMPTLPSLPGVLAQLLLCNGPHQHRSFVDALLGAAPTPARAVADQIGTRERVVPGRSTEETRNLVVVGPHGHPHERFDVFHGFAGWVWLTKTACHPR